MQLSGQHRPVRRVVAALVVAVTLTVSACASTVTGKPAIEDAANADLHVVNGSSSSAFDTTTQNALSDIIAFWKANYPSVSGGKPLPPLKGGFVSVDYAEAVKTHTVPPAAKADACIAQDPGSLIDNAHYCIASDSIAWDRAPDHLVGKLAQHYGPLIIALTFAHEFGHAVSHRLGFYDDTSRPQIDFESQADCASGAWAASALKNQDPHFLNVTPAQLDHALEGYLDIRDSTPAANEQLSHGNGFDRLSAFADGLHNGVKYCFSPSYFDRTFTERPYSDPSDYDAGGNQTLAAILAPDGALVRDLNRFWTTQAKTIDKTFTPVTIMQATHPKCGSASPTSEFGYCPDDNTVYYSASFAKQAYNSLPMATINPHTYNTSLAFHEPADFAMGELMSIGWGLAVRHQLFDRTMVDHNALLAAVCYTGAYAKDVNVSATTPGDRFITLSPADLDEAVSALLNQAGRPQAFGSRDTTGLDRIQSFVQGYTESLSSC